MEKTCYNCAYRGEVVGSVHTRCRFDWEKSELIPPKGDSLGIKKGWYKFPLNYDPVWQIEKCEAHSIEFNLDMVKDVYDSLYEYGRYGSYEKTK